MKVITSTKILGLCTFTLACLYANSLIKPNDDVNKPAVTETIKRQKTGNPLNDPNFLFATFALSLAGTGYSVAKHKQSKRQ